MEIIIQYKQCSKCKKDKLLDEFRKQERGKYGRKNYCIICDDINVKENYIKNKEKRKKQVTEWNKSNPEKTKEYQSNWRNRNSGDSSSMDW